MKISNEKKNKFGPPLPPILGGVLVPLAFLKIWDVMKYLKTLFEQKTWNW